MISYIRSTSGRLADAFIPETLTRSVKGMYNGLIESVDQLHSGLAHEYPKIGSEFLKSRSFFPQQSKVKLSRDVLFYGIITTVGVLLANTMAPFVGSFVAIGTAFYGIGAVRNHRQGVQLEGGSHLKQAILDLLEVKEWRNIPSEKVLIGGETVFKYKDTKQTARFNVDGKKFKFYVGSGFISPKGTQKYMVGEQVTAIWNRLHPVAI